MKRIWAFGIICILLTILFVGHILSTQRQAALQKARSDIDDLAQFVAMDLSRNFFGLNQVFLGVHNALEIAPEKSLPFSLQARHVLEEVEETSPFVTALLVVSPSGEIMHWTGSGELPAVRDRNYFTAHKERHVDGLFVTVPFPSRKYPGQWIFAVSNAYREKDGTLKYVIVSIVDLDYFKKNYADLRLAQGEALTLLSHQGDLYMRKPGHEGLSGKNIPRIAERLQGIGDRGFLRVTSIIDGTVRGISIVRIDDYPLVVAASYDEQIVLSGWKKGALVITGFGAAVVVTFFLLTLATVRAQRKQADVREVLQKQAITDPLTQLANRRHAVNCANLEIKKAQRQGTPLSFVLMDLDHFKKVNDTFGHEKGDLVLKRVAAILNELCRQTDVVSRFGGEEFLLILPNTDQAGAEINSEKIRKALAKGGYGEAPEAIQMTASFGVAQWDKDESAFEVTLRRADRALYDAKDKGRNRIEIASVRD